MKAGSAIASKAPDRILRAAKDAKFFAPACAINNTPHIKMLNARYHPGRHLCMIRFDGIAQKSHPK